VLRVWEIRFRDLSREKEHQKKRQEEKERKRKKRKYFARNNYQFAEALAAWFRKNFSAICPETSRERFSRPCDQ
jgi:cell shape-determining protein MreC